MRPTASTPPWPRVRLADTPWRRLAGLLGRRRLDPGEALLLRPCSGVHTCFMRFPIDVLFLDGAGVVLAMRHRLAPWRFARHAGARQVLELAAGRVAELGLRVGHRCEVPA